MDPSSSIHIGIAIKGKKARSLPVWMRKLNETVEKERVCICVVKLAFMPYLHTLIMVLLYMLALTSNHRIIK